MRLLTDEHTFAFREADLTRQIRCFNFCLVCSLLWYIHVPSAIMDQRKSIWIALKLHQTHLRSYHTLCGLLPYTRSFKVLNSNRPTSCRGLFLLFWDHFFHLGAQSIRCRTWGVATMKFKILLIYHWNWGCRIPIIFKNLIL